MLYQIYYTSAQQGVTGKSPGLQVVSATADCPSNLYDLVEKYASYHYENDFPIKPTREDYQKLPLMFSYQKLSNGWKMIYQTVYTGLVDYSNRQVPFSHFLVWKDDEPGINGEMPILFWKSTDFWIPDFDTTDDFPHEKILEKLDGIQKNPEMVPAFIREFLLSDGRAEYLPHLFTALKEYFIKPRRIIIGDGDHNTAKWIYILSFLLPASLVDKITFLTYNHDPQWNGDHIITGTTRETAFEFSNMNVKQIFYVFDFIEKVFSPIEKIDKYGKFAVELLKKGDYNTIHKFTDFCDSLSNPITFDDLFGLFVIFGLSENLEFSYEELSEGIDVFLRFLNEKTEILIPVIDKAFNAKNVPAGDVFKVTGRLMEYALKADIPEKTRNRLTQNFFTFFLNSILDLNDVSVFKKCKSIIDSCTIPSSYWSFGRNKLYATITTPGHPEVSVILMEMISSTELINFSDHMADKIMYDVILPEIPQNEIVSSGIEILVKAVGWNRIASLIIDYLDRMTEEEEKLKSVVDEIVKRTSITMDTLIQFAKKKKKAELFLKLNICKSDFGKNKPKRLVQIFTELTAILGKNQENLTELANYLIHKLWDDKNGMTEEELYALIFDEKVAIESIFSDDLSLGKIVEKTILNYKDLITPKKPFSLVIKELSKNGDLQNKKELSAFRKVYGILEDIRKLSVKLQKTIRDDALVSLILDVYTRIPTTNAIVRRQLIEISSAVLIDSTKSFKDHLAQYIQCIKVAGNDFLESYRQALNLCAENEILSADQVIIIFKVLYDRTSQGKCNPLEKDLLDTDFLKLYKSNKKILKKIKEKMDIDRYWSQKFSDWEKKHRGFLSSIKSMFDGMMKN